MQRREGVEKARKENHFKKREQSFFAPFRAFLSVFALVFYFSFYCFGVKTYSLCLGYRPIDF